MKASEPLGARLRGALDACPFLRAVAEEQGAFCAARVACCARGAGPVLQEQDDDCLAATWRLFHSAGGVVPLRTPGSPMWQPDAAPAPRVCPVTGRRAACPRQDAGEAMSVGDCAVAPHPRSTLPALQTAQAPLASISIPLLGLLVRSTPGASLGPRATLCVHLLTFARVSHTRVSRIPDRHDWLILTEPRFAPLRSPVLESSGQSAQGRGGSVAASVSPPRASRRGPPRPARRRAKRAARGRGR